MENIFGYISDRSKISFAAWIFYFSALPFAAAQPILTVDSLVVKVSNDTVFVWDYNAWEQCAFQLYNVVEITDSIVTITQVDTAEDMTTCYGYHNFVTPVAGLTEGKYRFDIYRDCLYQDVRFIGSIRFDYNLSAVENDAELLSGFKLFDAYPNPFGETSPTGNPTTTIKYSIPAVKIRLDKSGETLSIRRDASQQKTILRVYDILGRKIATLVNEIQPPGNYEVSFDGSQLSAGIYLYTLETPDFFQAKKMTLVK